jgi:hypothetical protein
MPRLQFHKPEVATLPDAEWNEYKDNPAYTAFMDYAFELAAKRKESPVEMLPEVERMFPHLSDAAQARTPEKSYPHLCLHLMKVERLSYEAANDRASEMLPLCRAQRIIHANPEDK